MSGSLYKSIAYVLDDDPNTLATEILKILRKHLNLIAASFYSYDPERSLLVLRGQVGLDYQNYESFELNVNGTYAGDGLLQDDPLFIENININSQRFRDKKLVRKYNLQSLVAKSLPSIYMRNTSPPIDKLGVICLYPQNDDPNIITPISEVAPLISRMYETSIANCKTKLRSKFVEKAGYSHDISSLLHRASKVIRDEINADEVSIFLWDEMSDSLILRATSANLDTELKQKMRYEPNSTDPSNIAFRKQQITFFHPDNISNIDQFIPLEIDNSQIINCVLLPFCEASVPPKQITPKPVGLLRIINHKTTHMGVSHPTSASWEDVLMFKFIAELISVSVHFMHKGAVAEWDYLRRMHGVKANLGTSYTRLKVVNGILSLPKYSIPEKYANYLNDALWSIDDIVHQIKRLQWRNDHSIINEPIKLYRDVLSKLPQHVGYMSREYNVKNFKFNTLSEAGFPEIPEVSGNKEALTAVFRNLAENSVKYCNTSPDARNGIYLSYEINNDYVNIYFKDYGIGVSAEDADYIFKEGFRTDRARARYPSSTGFGLADCYWLLDKMGGSICLRTDLPDTVFEIKLRIANKQ